MKQLDLTPQIQNLIANAVGPDVDPQGLSVFEAIATNNLPLPGKGGTIFNQAVIAPLTLRQMADSINEGNSLPLIWSHNMDGTPAGRVFYAEVVSGDQGQLELRVLFYVDQTEAELVTKLNAGSLDEVSVSFLPSQIACSECGFDYMGPDATSQNLIDQTCPDGHEIGDNGVHADLIGLSRFIELSLVTRGAADGAKIVGKTASKLIPATAMRLAARGFDTDHLVCRASQGESKIMTVDVNKLIADLSASQAEGAVLKAAATAHDAVVAALNTQVTALEASVTSLTEDRDAALALASEVNADDYKAALTFLQETATKVLTAAELSADNLPKTAAELSALIAEHSLKLSAILPLDGKSSGKSSNQPVKKPLGAFKMAVK